MSLSPRLSRFAPRRSKINPRDLVNHAGAAPSLESLEPRTLLAAYAYQSLVERFDLPQVLRDFGPQNQVIANFGAAAERLGDIDADGYEDFAISATGTVDESGATIRPGVVFLYSGRTGDLIRSHSDGFAEFGTSLASMGDYNGDGVPDFTVGSPRYEDDANAVFDPVGGAYVFSGADGSILRFFRGYKPNGEFGRAIAAAGYYSPDFRQELLVGAPADGPNGEGRAYVLRSEDVLLGIPGVEIFYTFTGQAAGDRFGAAVSAPETTSPIILPFTGIAPILPIPPDYFIGAPGNDAGGADAGRAYLFDHRDGSVMFTFQGPAAGDGFGSSVGVARNFTEVELLVGAPGTDRTVQGVHLTDTGAVLRFRSDATAVFLGPIEGSAAGERLGLAITASGDVNGDGIQDVAISRAASNPARFFSGRGLAEFEPPTGIDANVGTLAIGVGDQDHDGVDDVLTLYSGGNRATVVSSLLIVPPTLLSGGNDSGSFLFYDPFPSGNAGYRSHYAVVNGVLTPVGSVPGMEFGGIILGVNNSGFIVGANEQTNQIGGNIPVLTGLFLVREGVRTSLSDAITNVVGGVTPNLDNFSFIKIGNDGSALFHEVFGDHNNRAWLFKDGTLTFLWVGTVSDVNDSGSVLGRKTDPFTRDVIRAANGDETIVSGFFNATRLTNDNVVYGVAPVNLLAKWRNGTITILADLTSLRHANSNITGGRVIDSDALGRLVIMLNITAGHGFGTAAAIYYPEAGGRLAYLSDRVFGPVTQNAHIAVSNPIRFIGEQGTAAGTIVTNSGLLKSIGENDPWTAAPGAPIGPSTGPGGAAVGYLNGLNSIVIVRQEGGAWTGRQINLVGVTDPTDVNVITYTDPRDSLTYTFAFANGRVFWGRTINDPTLTGMLSELAGTGWTPIVANASLFIAADGRVHLAGTDPNGDLVLYYQNNTAHQSLAANWSYANLAIDHVGAGGQAFVPVAGGVTTYAASWGANHIAYLDAAGHVQTVWWAPGQTLWRTDDLSEIAAAPALHGVLVSYVTSWNGLNVVGTDASGHLTALWWVPNGQWRTDRLNTSGVELAADSLGSFVTPWGALNVVGRRADTGEVAIYWWAPATNQWRAESLALDDGGSPVVLTGRLSSQVSGATQQIFGRRDSGDLMLLKWTASAGMWSSESITALTV